MVSRVLGRHLPARPSLMRAAARDLAAKLPLDLPGPVLVFGFAETAICLGQTVHEELWAASGRDDIFFLHSTRVRIDHPLICRFEEPHSHAPAHLVYRPDAPGWASPRSLVLVDDEVSTGTTLLNAAEALVDLWPEIGRVVVASLTDWSGADWLERMPRPAARRALLSGRLGWSPKHLPQDEAASEARLAIGALAMHRNVGRTGIRVPVALPAMPLPAVAGPLRIVGTGEFTYLPFLLAEVLEEAGHDVVMQATSRSPARIGGVIGSALCFGDDHGAGVPNYLYNAGPADGRANWICHDGERDGIDPALIETLGAELVRWTE